MFVDTIKDEYVKIGVLMCVIDTPPAVPTTLSKCLAVLRLLLSEGFPNGIVFYLRLGQKKKRKKILTICIIIQLPIIINNNNLSFDDESFEGHLLPKIPIIHYHHK